MGFLVRCDGCSALRWSLRAKPGDRTPANCEICGTALKLERRRPGGALAKAGGERRDFHRPRGTPAPQG